MDCVTGLKEPLNLEGNWRRTKADLQVGPGAEKEGCKELRTWALDKDEGDGECDSDVFSTNTYGVLSMSQAQS